MESYMRNPDFQTSASWLTLKGQIMATLSSEKTLIEKPEHVQLQPYLIKSYMEIRKYGKIVLPKEIHFLLSFTQFF